MRPKTAPSQRPALAALDDAAGYLRLSRAMIKKLVRAGTVPSVTIGRARRIRWADLERLAGTGAPAVK
jgi:excisionase family DNA binding protein